MSRVTRDRRRGRARGAPASHSARAARPSSVASVAQFEPRRDARRAAGRRPRDGSRRGDRCRPPARPASSRAASRPRGWSAPARPAVRMRSTQTSRSDRWAAVACGFIETTAVACAGRASASRGATSAAPAVCSSSRRFSGITASAPCRTDRRCGRRECRRRRPRRPFRSAPSAAARRSASRRSSSSWRRRSRRSTATRACRPSGT